MQNKPSEQRLTCRMSFANIASMAKDNKLPQTIPAFRVSQEVYDVMQLIIKKDRRKIGETARALLERGVAAFLRDGEIFEPVQDEESIDVEIVESGAQPSEKDKRNRKGSKK